MSLTSIWCLLCIGFWFESVSGSTTMDYTGMTDSTFMSTSNDATITSSDVTTMQSGNSSTTSHVYMNETMTNITSNTTYELSSTESYTNDSTSSEAYSTSNEVSSTQGSDNYNVTNNVYMTENMTGITSSTTKELSSTDTYTSELVSTAATYDLTPTSSSALNGDYSSSIALQSTSDTTSEVSSQMDYTAENSTEMSSISYSPQPTASSIGEDSTTGAETSAPTKDITSTTISSKPSTIDGSTTISASTNSMAPQNTMETATFIQADSSSTYFRSTNGQSALLSTTVQNLPATQDMSSSTVSNNDATITDAFTSTLHIETQSMPTSEVSSMKAVSSSNTYTTQDMTDGTSTQHVPSTTSLKMASTMISSDSSPMPLNTQSQSRTTITTDNLSMIETTESSSIHTDPLTQFSSKSTDSSSSADSLSTTQSLPESQPSQSSYTTFSYAETSIMNLGTSETTKLQSEETTRHDRTPESSISSISSESASSEMIKTAESTIELTSTDLSTSELHTTRQYSMDMTTSDSSTLFSSVSSNNPDTVQSTYSSSPQLTEATTSNIIDPSTDISDLSSTASIVTTLSIHETTALDVSTTTEIQTSLSLQESTTSTIRQSTTNAQTTQQLDETTSQLAFSPSTGVLAFGTTSESELTTFASASTTVGTVEAKPTQVSTSSQAVSSETNSVQAVTSNQEDSTTQDIGISTMKSTDSTPMVTQQYVQTASSSSTNKDAVTLEDTTYIERKKGRTMDPFVSFSFPSTQTTLKTRDILRHKSASRTRNIFTNTVFPSTNNLTSFVDHLNNQYLKHKVTTDVTESPLDLSESLQDGTNIMTDNERRSTSGFHNTTSSNNIKQHSENINTHISKSRNTTLFTIYTLNKVGVTEASHPRREYISVLNQGTTNIKTNTTVHMPNNDRFSSKSLIIPYTSSIFGSDNDIINTSFSQVIASTGNSTPIKQHSTDNYQFPITREKSTLSTVQSKTISDSMQSIQQELFGSPSTSSLVDAESKNTLSPTIINSLSAIPKISSRTSKGYETLSKIIFSTNRGIQDDDFTTDMKDIRSNSTAINPELSLSVQRKDITEDPRSTISIDESLSMLKFMSSEQSNTISSTEPDSIIAKSSSKAPIVYTDSSSRKTHITNTGLSVMSKQIYHVNQTSLKQYSPRLYSAHSYNQSYFTKTLSQQVQTMKKSHFPEATSTHIPDVTTQNTIRQSSPPSISSFGTAKEIVCKNESKKNFTTAVILTQDISNTTDDIMTLEGQFTENKATFQNNKGSSKPIENMSSSNDQVDLKMKKYEITTNVNISTSSDSDSHQDQSKYPFSLRVEFLSRRDTSKQGNTPTSTATSNLKCSRHCASMHKEEFDLYNGTIKPSSSIGISKIFEKEDTKKALVTTRALASEHSDAPSYSNRINTYIITKTKSYPPFSNTESNTLQPDINTDITSISTPKITQLKHYSDEKVNSRGTTTNGKFAHTANYLFTVKSNASTKKKESRRHVDVTNNKSNRLNTASTSLSVTPYIGSETVGSNTYSSMSSTLTSHSVDTSVALIPSITGRLNSKQLKFYATAISTKKSHNEHYNTGQIYPLSNTFSAIRQFPSTLSEKNDSEYSSNDLRNAMHVSLPSTELQSETDTNTQVKSFSIYPSSSLLKSSPKLYKPTTTVVETEASFTTSKSNGLGTVERNSSFLHNLTSTFVFPSSKEESENGRSSISSISYLSDETGTKSAGSHSKQSSKTFSTEYGRISDNISDITSISATRSGIEGTDTFTKHQQFIAKNASSSFNMFRYLPFKVTSLTSHSTNEIDFQHKTSSRDLILDDMKSKSTSQIETYSLPILNNTFTSKPQKNETVSSINIKDIVYLSLIPNNTNKSFVEVSTENFVTKPQLLGITSSSSLSNTRNSKSLSDAHSESTKPLFEIHVRTSEVLPKSSEVFSSEFRSGIKEITSNVYNLKSTDVFSDTAYRQNTISDFRNTQTFKNFVSHTEENYPSRVNLKSIATEKLTTIAKQSYDETETSGNESSVISQPTEYKILSGSQTQSQAAFTHSNSIANLKTKLISMSEKIHNLYTTFPSTRKVTNNISISVSKLIRKVTSKPGEFVTSIMFTPPQYNTSAFTAETKSFFDTLSSVEKTSPPMTDVGTKSNTNSDFSVGSNFFSTKRENLGSNTTTDNKESSKNSDPVTLPQNDIISPASPEKSSSNTWHSGKLVDNTPVDKNLEPTRNTKVLVTRVLGVIDTSVNENGSDMMTTRAKKKYTTNQIDISTITHFSNNYIASTTVDTTETMSTEGGTSMTETTVQQEQSTQSSDDQTTTQPDSQTTQQSDSQTTTQPDSQTTQQSDRQTTTQPDSQTSQQSDSQTTTQPDSQTTQSDSQTTQQSDSQTTQQSDSQTTQQSHSQTTQQSDSQTTQQSDSQSTQQSDGQTTQQSDMQTTQQSDSQTTQQSNSQTTQQSDSQTTQQSDIQTTQQSDSQTTQQSDSQTTQQSDSQTTQQSDSQTTQSSVTVADPCTGVTCQNGGTCRPKPSIPTESECVCTADYEGDTCQYAAARFSAWGAWGSCSQTCRGATKTRSRTCTDVTNANRTGDCTGDSTEEILCSEITAECPLTSDPCVDDPNICFTDGINHTCATNADGTFRCVCADGFMSDSNNRYCINKDECATTTNLCRDVNTGSFKTGISGCTDNVGSYSCTCATGYMASSNTNNRDCNDIDECTSNTDNCDAADRATCTNTGGSFTCACNQGFTGDGTTGSCTENRLMSTTGHTEVPSSSDFSEYMFFDFAVPFGTTLLPSAYITKSGLVLLTTVAEQTQSQGVRKSFANPGNTIDPSFQEKAAFAAWWGNMVFNTGNSSMYYKLYKSTVTADMSALTSISSEIASQFGTPATGSAFSAREMIVATWIRMGQAAVPSQMVTFQAVVVTDYINTYCKATYGDRDMLWNIVVGSVSTYPVVVGYILSDGTRVNYPYSSLDMLASSASTNKPKLEQIDNVIVNNESPPSTIKGNSKGIMYYRITNHDSTFEHLGMKCKTWIDDDTQNNVSQIEPRAEQRCPAELKQMTTSFQVFDTVAGSDCYSERSADSAFATDKRSLRCCYKNSALVTDHSLVNGKNTYRIHAQNDSRQVMADTTYGYCCDAGNAYFAREDLCQAFLSVRPVCNSNNFSANAAGGGLGDPHLTTLDHLSFTFNGHGEFVVLKTGMFELQGRFLPLTTNGVKTATFIGGIAAQQTNPNSDRVEIILNSTRDGIDIYKNGNLQTLDLSSSVDLPEVTLTKTTVNNTDTYRMIFSNGISVGVQLENSIFSFVLEISSNFANSVEGLLGNFNGNQEDDYTFPNGTVLPEGINATESEIYDYGLTWQNNETNTLFSYPGGQWSDFVDANYTPIFFNSDLTVMFPNATERTLAQDVCYQTGQTDPDPVQRRECYFDFKVTQDSSLAQGTSSSQASLEQTQQSLANYPPEITNGNVTLEVMVGSSYSSLLTLVTEDRNGDSVTLTVNADAPSGVSINSATKQLSWTSVPDISSGTIEITASDGNAQSIFIPKIELCNCQNGGTCDFSVSSNDLFIVVPCICPTGYVGPSCETDEDGCADGPCFSGVSCTDVPASQLASNSNPFICGSCPVGLVGNGQTCTDQDECQDVPPRCSQICTNIAFGFECSCNSGYSLDADTVTCNDVDECQRNTDSCDDASTMCVNTVGSYNCSCKTGYQPSSNPMQCEDMNECSASSSPCPANSRCENSVGSFDCLCNYGYSKNTQSNICENIDECALNNNCEQICTDGIGLYTCSCRNGFTLQNDTISCQADTVCNSTQRAGCDGGNARSSCSVLNGEVQCICPQGFTLSLSNICENIDECTAGTDVCVSSSSDCMDFDGGYNCTCKTGYNQVDSLTCQDIDECTSNTHSCAGPAVCQNIAGSYTCTCPSGYTLASSGLSCDNIDECGQATLNLCDKQNGNCTDTTPGYTCFCQNGYTGDGFTCTDLNECAQSDRGGCQQQCRNSIGSFTCSCNEGYTLAGDGSTCNNIDECANDILNECLDSTNYCTDTTGSYDCSCPANFTLKGDGRTCESDFKCATGHNCSHTCGRINNVDTCHCPNGYQVGSDGKTCEDINECSNSTLNNCDQANKVTCFNLVGSFRCDCVNSSYQSVSSTMCTDVDECLNPSNGCPANSQCVNSDPGFSCTCLSGYVSVAGNCQDDDECVKGTHACNVTIATCSNTDGGYTCTCKAGYSGNGITCTDVDECVDGTHTCDRRAGVGLCTNNVGSFSCACSSGYTLASNGLTCNDVDECRDGTNNCEFGCTNNDGGFTCTCPTGYRLQADQRTCVVEVACASGHGCSFQCANVNGQDTCICQDGYNVSATNSTQCDDVDECQASPGPCDQNFGSCTNTQGSYNCSCLQDYILGPSDTCADRNGNWGNWGAWGTCSQTCGTGSQSRTRACDNPTKEGNGAECQGSNSETQNCNTNVCPANDVEATYGVEIIFQGLTIAQFNAIGTSFKQTVTTEINSYCNANTSTVQQCCSNSNTNYSPSPGSTLVFTTSDKISIGDSYPVVINGGLYVMIVVKADQNNALCTAAASSTGSRRKKRAISLTSWELAIPQSVLQSILNDVSVQNDIVTALENAIQQSTGQSVNITISQIALVTTVATTTETFAYTTIDNTTATTTTMKSETSVEEKEGTKGWVIAVAVIGAILGVLMILLIIILIVKLKGNKVHPEDEEQIQPGNQYHTNQNHHHEENY